jgi:hypothetical protein
MILPESRIRIQAWVQGGLAVALCLVLFVVASAAAENPKENALTEHVTGTFEVKVVPESIAGKAPVPGMMQMSIDKTFHGDLDGTSKGSMLTAGDPKAGEAGYVALEVVTGTLKGRAGSFALMQRATMSGGGQAMEVSVVPGSGTGALKGIAGTFVIRIESGKHTYDFDYTLPK